MKQTKRKRPTQHEAGGAGRKADRGASDPRHHRVLSESRSPAWASSRPLACRGVVVLQGVGHDGEGYRPGLSVGGWHGHAVRRQLPRQKERDTHRQTDRSGEGTMRTLLAPSRQANGWADRPMVGCSDRQQGTCGQASMSQAGRQAASREDDAVGGCPVRGMASLQLLPAGASVCGLELGVHHSESWPACKGKQSRWLLVSKQVGGQGREEGEGHKYTYLSQALTKTECWPPFVAGSPLVQIWK